MAGKMTTPRIRVAAIIVRDGMVLLVQHAKNGRTYWMLPGGGVDTGEALDAALRRELREEACVTIDVGELALANDSIEPGGGRHILNLYFTATIAAGEPMLGNDPRIVDIAFLPIEALERIALFPPVAPELLALLQGGRGPVYIGNRWSP